MGKILGWIALMFFGLAALNYVFVMGSNFFSGLGSVHAESAPYNSANFAYDYLPSVNFNFFDPTHAGKDYLTQGYGRTSDSYLYIGGWHNGVDIAANYGALIYSPAAGTVVATGNQDNYCPRLAFGKFVVVNDAANHLTLLFAHLGNIDVAPGATIAKGAPIGTIGSTGDETGPHLHFSVFETQDFSMTPAHGCGPYPQGHDVDPLDYLGATYHS